MMVTTNVHRIERRVVSSWLMFLIIISQLQRGNSLNSLNPFSTNNNQKLMLSTTEGGSYINVTFMGTVSEYKVFTKYDFFIPDIDVVCQCSCTDRDTLRSCPLDHECATLVNSTTSCTIHIVIDTDRSFCNQLYKLCCQVYFTKSKLVKPFKALYLKYHQTLLNLKIISKSNMSESDKYNVTVTKNVKRILLNPDKVLHISEFVLVHPKPESWYFIEEGSNELHYSDAMNGIEDGNLNKIGWFQYSVREKRLSRVSLWDLKKQLQVKVVDCHSNPPKYEWKLNATYYGIKKTMHYPDNVEKVSELYKDISKILVDLKEEIIKIGRNNPSSVNISLSNANLYPFLFTSTIKDTVLNLTFTKGNGTFNVEITSPHWTNVFSFSTEAREKIIKLPDKNYDSCWVCVSQKSQELCQMPSLIKYEDRSVITSPSSELNETFQTEVINIKVTGFPTNTSSSTPEISSNLVVVITATTVSAFILVTSLLVIIILNRRRQRLKTRVAIDDMEMEPFTSDSTSPQPRSIFTKRFRWGIFSNLTEPTDRNQMQKQFKGIVRQIEGYQRNEYKGIELPQVNWTNRILPLEELYVNLELSKTADDCGESEGQEMLLEKMFDKIDGVEPVRILVEGGPGYGKSTLCLKLLSDWENKRKYISSKFRMLFHLVLRYFKQGDSIEAVLKEEFKAMGVNGDDGINCIKAFQNETLLILDGFDEMNDECKKVFFPLLLRKTFPSLFIVLTSRRGIFQMEKKKEQEYIGFLKKKKDKVTLENCWTKRILIKGVTTDKIETFLSRYLEKDYQEIEGKMNFIVKGKMREVFQCPLFLILLAMILEEKKIDNFNSKTTLFKEFFNFISRRNLIRERKLSDEEEVDFFNESSDHSELVQSLIQFGRLAIDYLIEDKLIFDENDILKSCNNNIFLDLGFLTKIPKKKNHARKNFCQPIHKSFLEFVSAFAMWNLFKTDENQFMKELKTIGEKGLKPTDDSLFYVFLGGFMNNKAYVLFQSLTSHGFWFNIESLCFANILLEIQEIDSFFPSFQPILDSFISSFYSIDGMKGLTSDYFQSEIHSLILKHSSDRQLIKVLEWNPIYSINTSHDLHFDCLRLNISEEVIHLCTNENTITCKNIICEFSTYLQTDEWSDFVSLLNSFRSEKVNFCFVKKSNDVNSPVFHLLHKELMEGEWKQMNVDRLRFELNESGDPQSLTLLVDLVKKNSINEGVFLWIHKSERRTNEESDFLKREAEELFNAVTESKTIKEFIVINSDFNFSPEFDVSRIRNKHLKSFHLLGSLKLLKSDEMKTVLVEEVGVRLSEDFMDISFIKNIENVKNLGCKLICFNSLIEIGWSGLKQIEKLELMITNNEQVTLLNSVPQLINLHVLILDLTDIQSIPSESKLIFIDLFSSLNLKICKFLRIQNVELFSFLTEALTEGLKMKAKDENNSSVESREGKKFHLQQLIFQQAQIEMDSNQLKQCKGIRSIQSMLREKLLKQCCWIDYFDVTKSHQLKSLFPSNHKFKISHEVDGMNRNSDLDSQNNYRWFVIFDKICVEFCE